ncbi:MAG: ubiquitin-protein ligase mind-bomb [Chlamydiales bacterium]|jgi:hypothetical protein|nr:ubiquitin-protein ligase mind-bomb [Chlamydiales bacterium]
MVNTVIPTISNFQYLRPLISRNLQHPLLFCSQKLFKRYVSNQAPLQFIPHKFSYQEAAKRFVDQDRNRLFKPLDIENPPLPIIAMNQEPLLKKVFIPLYGVNAIVKKTHFDGEYGIQHTTTTVVDGKAIVHTYTNWFPISGTIGSEHYTQEDSEMCIYGGFTWDTYTIEKAMSKAKITRYLQPFEPKQVESDTIVDPFIKRSAIANETAMSRIQSYEQIRAQQSISSRVYCHFTRVHKLDIEFQSFKLSHYLLPSYILQYPQSPPRIMPAFSNQTSIVGAAPLSITKVMAATTVASTILSFMFPAVSIPMRLGIIALSSTASGIWAKTHLLLRYNMQEHKLCDEKKQNESVAETLADQKRRELTEPFFPKQIPIGQVLNIDQTHFEALGLKSDYPVTEAIVRKAFNEQIKKAHPDHRDGSATKAQNLINARNTIIAAIHKNMKGANAKRTYSSLSSVTIKEPPRSIYDPRAGELIKLVLSKKNYNRALVLVNTEELHPDSHDKGENTLLSEAAKRGDVTVICFAIDELRASPDTSCDCPAHRTPLHYAVSKGHLPAVEALLKRGAHPNLINSYGETPLDLAYIENDQSIIDLLISYNALRHSSVKGKINFWNKLFGYNSKNRTILLEEKKKEEKPIYLPPPANPHQLN